MFTAKTDAELCHASAQGQHAAFEELVRRYQGAVCAVTYAATGRRDLSEDLAQDAFLIAWKKLRGIRTPERVGGWLAGIARNLARKSRRAVVDLPLEHADHVGDEAMDVENAAVEQESRQQVWTLLETLPARYREVLVLYYREGRSAQHVAEQLGLSLSATEQRLSRGRRLLRDKVERALERELTRTAPSSAFTRRVAAALPLTSVATATGGATSAASPWMATLAKALVMKKLVTALAVLVLAVLAYAVVSDRRPDPGATTTPSAQTRRSGPTLRDHDTPAKSEPAGVQGTVRSSTSGEPVLGAVVTITTPSGTAAFVRAGGRSRLAVARANEAGRFELSGLAPGRYVATASAPGHYGHQHEAFIVRPGITTRNVAIALTQGGLTISGAALDIGGGAVEGAVIRAEQGARTYATMTDTEGRYMLDVPPGHYRLSAWDEDYERVHRRTVVRGANRTVDFELIPASSIRGLVVEPDGRTPVEGAVISFSEEVRRGGYRSSRGSEDEETVVSGPDGHFTLRGLSPATYKVYAHADHRAALVPAEVRLGIAEHFEGLVVRVDPAFNVRGRVVDRADTTVGIPEASVKIAGRDASASVRTLDDGGFEILGVLPGEHALMIEGEDIIASSLQTRVTVEDTDVSDVEAQVQRGVMVSGHVEPAQIADVHMAVREGVGGFEVLLKGKMLGGAKGRSDETGRFTLSAVPPGEWLLIAEGTDGSLAELEVSVPEQGMQDIALQMHPRASLRGRVSAGDDATAGLTVRLTRDSAPMGSSAAMLARTNAALVVTDQDGAFEIVGVDPGPYRLSVQDRREVPWTRTGEPADDPGLAIDVAETNIDGLVLSVDAPRGSVHGVVTGPDGPIEDAWVTLWNDKRSPSVGEIPRTVTDAEGLFSFEGLAHSQYTVRADSEHGDATGEATAVETGDNVEIVLEALGTLSGTVTTDGRPVQQFEVRVGGVQRRFLDGRFELSGVPHGPAVVVVNAKEGCSTSRVDIQSETTALELELGAWGTVQGRAVTPEGTPAAGVPLSWSMQGGERDRTARVTRQLAGETTTTDSGGRFHIEGLGAGRGRITFGRAVAFSPGVTRAQAVVFLEPGAKVDVGDVVVRQGDPVDKRDRGSLGIRVKAAFDRPLEGGRGPAHVEAPSGPASLWVAQIDPAGPAADLGLEVGQTISAVNDESVDDRGAAALAVELDDAWVEAGKRYTLTVDTTDGPKTVEVTAQPTRRRRPGKPGQPTDRD